MSFSPHRASRATREELEARKDYDNLLIDAVCEADFDRVMAYLKLGASTSFENGLAFRNASGMGDVKIMEALLDYDADPNVLDGCPLFWAARHGSMEAVELLVEYGVDINGFMGAPLREACRNGHTDIVNFLLDSGADVHAGWKGKTLTTHDDALRAALEHGQSEIVDLLIKRGAVHPDEIFEE